MHLTYNIKLIFGLDSDKESLIKMLEAQQFAFNEASKINFTLKKNSIINLHSSFYKKFRSAYPEIPSQIVSGVRNESLSCYRAIKSMGHKINKPVVKNKLSMRLDKGSFSYKKEIFSILSLGKRVKCKGIFYPKITELFRKYKFCNPLIFKRDNDLFLAMTFEIPEVLVQNKIAVGVDLGIRVFAATSDGVLYKDSKFKAEKRRLRFLKRKLQSCGSKSAKRHSKKIRRKEANKNKNFLHHLSNHILSTSRGNVIVLEDLKGIKKRKNKFQNKNKISQISFAELRRILTYKAPLYNKEVKTVDPHYSSQTDCVSGKVEGKRCGRRFYSVSGKVFDAEINAAINLAKKTNHPRLDRQIS